MSPPLSRNPPHTPCEAMRCSATLPAAAPRPGRCLTGGGGGGLGERGVTLSLAEKMKPRPKLVRSLGKISCAAACCGMLLPAHVGTYASVEN